MSFRIALTAPIIAAASVLAMPALAAAQMSDPAACRTALGIRCVTIHYTQSQWRLVRFGLADIFRTGLVGIPPVRLARFQRTSAVRRDGSTAIRTSEKITAGLFTAATEENSFSEMYLAPGDEVVQINDRKRIYSNRKSTWHDLPDRRSFDGDTTCSSAFRADTTPFQLAGAATVAGVPVAKWVYEDRLNRHEVYLAPSLDCAVLKKRLVGRNWAIGLNWFYLPASIYSLEAYRVERGEPKAELFAIPAGYARVESEGAAAPRP